MNYENLLQLTNGCGMMGNFFASHATRKAVNGSAVSSWSLQPLFFLSSSSLELSSWNLKVINHKVCNDLKALLMGGGSISLIT